MPSKKKKYNARFPAGRIKKIMQSDEEIGKVAQAVPVIISRTLELFVESLLTKTLKITNSRNAKTLSTSHMKQCIMSENRFDFLRDLVRSIPDINMAEDIGNESSSPGTPGEQDQPYDLSKPSTSCSSSVGGSGSNIPEFNISIPNNGNIQNGMQILCTSKDVPSISISSSSSPASLLPPNELKRQWDTVNRIRKNIEKHCTTITPVSSASVPAHSYPIMQHNLNTSTNHNVSVSSATPPKLGRTDSLPATTTITVDTNKNQSPAEQTNKHRRLQHQAKSVPCSSKDYTPPVSSQKTIVTPAPIDFSIDFSKKPIVKIDYSNLALHDTSIYAKTATTRKAANETSTNSQNTISCSPVINIDLSNIDMSPNILPPINESNKSTSSASISTIGGSNHCITINSVQESFLSSAPSSSLLKMNSSLDLDEDYDNI